MKKIIIVIIAVMLMICLTSCRNDIGSGNYTSRRVHIFTHNGQDKCLEIQSWYNYKIGIQVHTKVYGTLYLSEGTYMLCESECPICGGK